MERRNFLKLALGLTAGAAVFAATAQAAPLSLPPLSDPARMPQGNSDAHPAVTTSEEAARLTPEQVHWRGRHRGWGHRHWRRHRRRRHRHHHW
ncbi:twin-arginine translocation signal domain-containing protein [Bradyrhizobium tunisiense]|uniref:twin-arginine translocation signal domain-containing protein n=1 Tax=Bradyrhizobium tunisiense TaxID=3278709 RepID=UPI0035DD45E4